MIKRVLILGCPGAGKSTAARRLAPILSLPLVHLDFHYWQPGWLRPTKEVWMKTLCELVSEPEWIMDGNYAGTLNQRLERADMVVHLDFTNHRCLWRVLKRMIGGYGGKRHQEFPDGCLEKLDLSFVWFVLNYRRTRRKRDLDTLSEFKGQLHSFNSPKDLEQFLRVLETGCS